MNFGPENIWLVAIGGFASFISSVLWAMGGTAGMGGKWLRRFLGTGILALTTNGIAIYLGSWAWPMILIWPALIGGSSLGYGADNTLEKVLKRTVFALACCTAGFFGLWATGFTPFGYGVLGLQFAIGLGSVYFGVVNPFKNAPLEQYVICQLLTMTIPFWGWVR